MISDESDEDADNLEDEALLGNVVGYDAPKHGSRTNDVTPVSDWPPLGAIDAGLDVDHATLAWFKENHADWREEISFVLRAWVTLNSQARLKI